MKVRSSVARTYDPIAGIRPSFEARQRAEKSADVHAHTKLIHVKDAAIAL